MPYRYVVLLWALPTPYTISAIGANRELFHAVSDCKAQKVKPFKVKGEMQKLQESKSEDSLTLETTT
jgi:hypothetical protein